MELGSVADWGLVTFAAATAYYAYQTNRSSKRTEWLIGALESQSTMRIRIEAKKLGLKVVAYDPSAGWRGVAFGDGLPCSASGIPLRLELV